MINWINWPKDLDIGTFQSKTCLLFEKDVEKEIGKLSNDPQNASKKVINVRIFDISWLSNNDRTFADFIIILNKCERNAIFSS